MNEHDFGSQLWSQQDPKFSDNLPVQAKSDFKSMHEVRSYAPNKPV
jgi:hypothetical protein